MEINSENEQKSGYEVLAETEERVILFAAAMDGVEVSETEKSLDELEELLKTAGAQSVGRLIQSRDRAASDLYLGRGKVEELRSMIAMYDATGVVCDDELSPAQLMNLQDALEIKQKNAVNYGTVCFYYLIYALIRKQYMFFPLLPFH